MRTIIFAGRTYHLSQKQSLQQICTPCSGTCCLHFKHRQVKRFSFYSWIHSFFNIACKIIITCWPGNIRSYNWNLKLRGIHFEDIFCLFCWFSQLRRNTHIIAILEIYQHLIWWNILRVLLFSNIQEVI